MSSFPHFSFMQPKCVDIPAGVRSNNITLMLQARDRAEKYLLEEPMKHLVVAMVSVTAVLAAVSVSYPTSMMDRAKKLMEMKVLITTQADNDWAAAKRDMERSLQEYLVKYNQMVLHYNASTGNNPQFVIQEVPHKNKATRILRILQER